jgi:hypothetical protein
VLCARDSVVKAACIVASGLAFVAVSGCSDDGLGTRYPVSGKVTYKGEPVAAGSISFYATGENAEKRNATGVIKDGYYTISTIGTDDGAFPGDYNVAISARQADMSQANANREKTGGSARQDDIAKAYREAKQMIPAKYENPDSGLKAKVVAGSNSIDFPLSD